MIIFDHDTDCSTLFQIFTFAGGKMSVGNKMSVESSDCRQPQSLPSTRPGRTSVEKIAKLAEMLFSDPVIRITAPGGSTRDSVRVHFEDWSLIASQRSSVSRLEREVAFLTHTKGKGAPVPTLMGVKDGVLFQTDLGTKRLTAELSRRSDQNLEALAANSFESLWRVKETVAGSNFLKQVKPIATGDRWVDRFANQIFHIAQEFQLPAPDYDATAMAKKLRWPATTFIKWDARPGNASLDLEGKVHWFDWEDYGLRGGVEDFAFLIGDEFWPLDAETSLGLFAASNRFSNDILPQLARFAMLCAAQRLRLIRAQWKTHGWVSLKTASRYDRIGGVEELIRPLCNRAADFAKVDSFSEELSEWLRSLASPELWRN